MMSLARFLDHVRALSPREGAVEESLNVGGRQVRVRYSSHRLAGLLGRSFQHLRQPMVGPPDLTISCWVGNAGDLFRLPTDWPESGTVFSEDGPVSLSWDSPDGPLVIYDREARHSWVRFASHEGVSMWEQATPFRKLLHWWAATNGLQLIHAAAVGRPSGGLILVGRGGSGKSTTALACLDAKLGYAGDDYCLVDPCEKPWVHSLYQSGKGDARTAGLLPGLAASLRESACAIQGKSVVFARDIRPDAIVPGFPLCAIVVPRIVGGPSTQLQRIASSAALMALAPSTLLQLPGGRSDSLGRLSRLVGRVPCWQLLLGDDPMASVPVLAGLLDGDSPANSGAT